VELPIVYSDPLKYMKGEIWLSIYVHAAKDAYTISNLTLVAGAYVAGETTNPGEDAPEPPPPARQPDTFFFVGLNNWNTAGTSEGGLNPNVPAATFADGKLTVPFTENGQRINLKLSDAQAAALEAREGEAVKFTLVASVVTDGDPSGDSFRYHIGAPGQGGSWNATSGSGDGALADKLVTSQTFGSNADIVNSDGVKDRLGFFILQHRNANAITIQIEQIKIEFVGEGGEIGGDVIEPINVVFSATDTVAVPGNNGTITYADGGYTFTYGTVANSNYGNGIVRFSVNLGSATLGNYKEVTFTWTGVSGGAASYKKLSLLAAAKEADITPYKADAAINALCVNGDDMNAGPQVNGTTPAEVTLPIVNLKDLTGVVWFSIYMHAAEGAYTISDLTFVPY